MKQNTLETVLALMRRLQEAHIYYTLAHNQEDAVTIQVVVPGQRWEIDCYVNGTIDVEVFQSNGSIANADAIELLFKHFADD